MSAFDKVIGYEDIKTELVRFCDVLKNPEFYKKLGVKNPSGILLAGEPGIGKTLMAECFIEESGCKTFTLRKDSPDGAFVDKIRNTFKEAKAEQCAIVFLDDMDKYANEDDEHRDAEEYIAVQSCIDDCRGSRVFVLATVNNKYALPDSLIRAGRFDKVIEMRCPKGQDAKKLVEYFLGQRKVIGDIDLDEISRLMEGHTCAELENVINEAGIYAGFERRETIEHKDLLKAYMRLIFDAPESMESTERPYLNSIAVHEAGHVIVAEVLNPGSVTLVSVCPYSGSTEGVTVTRRRDDARVSKVAMENDVIGTLGGKAATEIVFGQSDVGCSGDMRKAYFTCLDFVNRYCTLGFGAYERYEASEYSRANQDRLAATEMEKYYKQAKQIIAENRSLLDAITQKLMEKKTLTHRDIAELKEKLA